MKPPRGLTAEEGVAWARLAATVEPLKSGRQRTGRVRQPASPPLPKAVTNAGGAPAHLGSVAASHGLDASWDRRLRAGTAEPDFTLDLHGHSLHAAHARLDRGLAQARAMGARVVVLVTGKSRPVDAADRAERRGAIRAKVLDWLAVGPHANAIAAIRPAHRRHGGEGALYLVLRRER